MNLMWFVGIVCLSVVMVRSQEGQEGQVGKRGGVKLCGAHLADTLHLVCRGSYYRYWKKDTPYPVIGEGSSEDYVYDQLAEEAPPRWPFLSRQSANALMPRNDLHHRYRRGIIEECCHKYCSIDELRSYCS